MNDLMIEIGKIMSNDRVPFYEALESLVEDRWSVFSTEDIELYLHRRGLLAAEVDQVIDEYHRAIELEAQNFSTDTIQFEVS